MKRQCKQKNIYGIIAENNLIWIDLNYFKEQNYHIFAKTIYHKKHDRTVKSTLTNAA